MSVKGIKTKVLIVHPHIRQGGAEKHVVYFAYWLKQLGIEVKIATLSINLTGLPNFANELDYIIPSDPVNLPLDTAKLNSVFIYLQEFLSLRKLVMKNKRWADVIETHHFPTYWSTYGINKPMVLICHESYAGCLPGQIIKGMSSRNLVPVKRTTPPVDAIKVVRALFDRWIVKKSITSIVVLDDDDYAIVKASYGRSALVIPPGVDFESYKTGSPSKVLQRYSLSTDNFIILHVGELSVTKNQVASIKAARLLRNNIPNLKLVLVGTGPLNLKLHELVEKYQLQNIVLFTGRISEEELRDWYSACQINIFPSTIQSWGMAPFEGLAAGKPLVVSKTIGSAQIIQRAHLGLLIDPTAEALADGILKIYLALDYFEGIGKYGQEFVKKNLSWQSITKQLSMLLHIVAENDTKMI
jgi:glycosyltransferase involved in cell wall biosynthesis